MKPQLFTILLLLLSFLPLTAQTDKWVSKVSPHVLEKVQAEGKTDFLIWMKEQADLSKAKNLRTKEEKTDFVFTRTLAVAEATQPTVEKLIREHNAPSLSYFFVNALWSEGDLKLIREIAELPQVQFILYNTRFQLDEPLPADTTLATSRAIEWGIQNIKADSVWDMYGVTGAGVVVGGQDTGYKWDHAAIKSQYRGYDSNMDTVNHNYHWHDAIHQIDSHNSGSNPCGLDSPVPCDDHNHGTHTAGTMVGDDGGSNQIGVAPDAKWIGCRNMERGWGTMATYMECFQWFIAPYAIDDSPSQGDPAMAPHVINNSWGCPPSEGCLTDSFPIMDSMVNVVRTAGIVVVVSAGNDGSSCSSVSNPAAIYEGSFSVGATSSSDNIASFSSRGPVTVDGSNRRKPDVSAPGVFVRSCIRNGNYASWNGTSMAGPHVAGAVALIISADPGMAGQVDSIESLLESTARPRTSTQLCGSDTSGQVPNNVYGYGIINVLDAVDWVMNILPVEWLKLEGKYKNEGVNLIWETGWEENSQHFEVQHSPNGVEWSLIGLQKAEGKGDYRFRDERPFFPESYYRIKEVDHAGNHSFSQVIRIYTLENNPIFHVYPNPAKDRINFRLTNSLLFEEGWSLTIYSSLGQVVFNKELRKNELSASLPPGLYAYSIRGENGVLTQSGKIIFY
jgi:serine protease AprX